MKALALLVAPIAALWTGAALTLKHRSPLPIILAFAAVAVALGAVTKER